MNLFLSICIVTLLKLRVVKSTLNEDEIENSLKCSNSFCLPLDYNKLSPPFKESEPIEIIVTLDGVHFLEFDDTKFTVSLLLGLSIEWDDYRITGPDGIDPWESFPVDIGFANNLWLPDLYIYNMKENIMSTFNIPVAGKTNTKLEYL